jgi:orotate phosphoribosyltransferase
MAHLISRRRYDVIGGPAVGAIPIATAIQMTHALDDPRPDACIIRAAPKGHGLERQIETRGDITGRRVAIVEDTATTGGSVMGAIEAVQKSGGIVDCAAVIVDRGAGAREAIEALGVTFLHAYNLADLGLAAPQTG